MRAITIPVYLAIFFTLLTNQTFARNSFQTSLDSAVNRALEVSDHVAIGKLKLQESAEKIKQIDMERLPTAKISGGYSEAFIFTRKFAVPGMPQPLSLPDHAGLYMGSLSITQPIYAGGKFTYAAQSAKLMQQIAGNDLQLSREAVAQQVIGMYLNLYKTMNAIRIADKNLEEIGLRLEEQQKFEAQGLATRNDVLRWELQKANTNLSKLQFETDRKVLNYSLCVLLELPEETDIVPNMPTSAGEPAGEAPVQLALENRLELSSAEKQQQLATVQIKNAKAERLPQLGAAVQGYYINPNTRFIPEANTYLLPLTVGLNLSWSPTSLYQATHKINEAKLQAQEAQKARELATDQVQTQVYQQFETYKQALNKIEVLKLAVEQSTENDRIMQAKYQNQVATTTDRIDAETMLYQSQLNLVVAQTDALQAYYNLAQATGTLTKMFHLQ